MDTTEFDLIIVGSGFFGLTLAECAARELGLRVLILERRTHAGGNSYSSADPATGIEVHHYGSHLFHTNSQQVWDYLHRFTTFTNYRHRVVACHRNRFYTMPINLGTMSSYWGEFLSPAAAKARIAAEVAQAGIATPSNLEEKAISLIGRSLYEAFIKGYTQKQWQTDPRQLPANIITRLPVRYTFEDYYFTDRYEGLPLHGYGAIFDKMLKAGRVQLALNTDYFAIGRPRPTAQQLLVYTGPLDRYFDYRAGHLSWRTLDFTRETLPIGDYQGAAVVNYPDGDVPYTRIHEFRHLHPERQQAPNATIIAREFSRAASASDEPYYPINTPADQATYDAYQGLVAAEEQVIFGGRLGTYRYLDMHQAIGAALKVFEQQVKPFFVAQRPVTGNSAPPLP